MELENKHMSSETLQKRIGFSWRSKEVLSLPALTTNLEAALCVIFRRWDQYLYPVSRRKKFEAIAKNPNVCLLVSTDYVDFYQIKGQVFGKAVTSLQDSSLFQEVKSSARL